MLYAPPPWLLLALFGRSPRVSGCPDATLISAVAALHWLYSAATSPAAALDAAAAADSLHLLHAYCHSNKQLAIMPMAEVQSVSSKVCTLGR